MNVLLTNDDGVVSTGIRVMSRMLIEKRMLEGVIAPDRERSGTSHSMTMGSPVRVFPLDPGMFSSEVSSYSCDGTPTDCVSLGVDMLFPHADFVLSGINQGANMGDDVTYSGTVCAALEAVVLGRPAMAVSLAFDDSERFRYNTTAALVAMVLLEHLEAYPLPAGTFFNVNVPNLLLPQVRGFKLTKLGHRRYVDKFRTIQDHRGKECYWISGRIEDEHEEGTDITAVAEGWVSITPICTNMTSFEALDQLSSTDLISTLDAAIKDHN